MKRLTLYRESPTATEIRGRLEFDDQTLYTIERPWRPTSPGGESSRSCVPAGVYRLSPHRRPSGRQTLALTNPGLGVYYLDSDRPAGVGRFLILIHAANKALEVNGCIAPGTGRTIHDGEPMVTQSREAMRRILAYIGDDEAEIEIIGRNEYA